MLAPTLKGNKRVKCAHVQFPKPWFTERVALFPLISTLGESDHSHFCAGGEIFLSNSSFLCVVCKGARRLGVSQRRWLRFRIGPGCKRRQDAFNRRLQKRICKSSILRVHVTARNRGHETNDFRTQEQKISCPPFSILLTSIYVFAIIGTPSAAFPSNCSRFSTEVLQFDLTRGVKNELRNRFGTSANRKSCSAR